MKTYTDTDLTQFDFWSGAKDTAKRFTYQEMKEIEFLLEDIYPDGLSETELNDLFWFDEDFLCEMIGITTEELYER